MSGASRSGPKREEHEAEHKPLQGAHEEPGRAYDPTEKAPDGDEPERGAPYATPRAVPQGLPMSESEYRALKERAAAGGRRAGRHAQHDPASKTDDTGNEGSDENGEVPEAYP
jgi:hypothetical protein